MAISATLQLSEGSGALAALKENLMDIYTVLNIDYTVERSCDKTGRPSGGPKISVINVTIRAAKQKSTPFHDWIKGEDKLMNGVIKIYDSAGIISSSIQDATGADTLVDYTEITDIPDDMMGEAMSEGMNQASDYDTRDLDLYDETSHGDLVAKAKERGIVITNKDTDDDIRDMLRTWDDLNTTITDKNNNKTEFDKIDDDVDQMSLSELQSFAEENNIAEFEDEETDKMTLEQLKQYVKDNKLTVKDGASEEDYKKAVKEYKEKKYYQPLVKKNKKAQAAKEKKQASKLADQSYAPTYQKADELKKRTVTTSKQVTKELTRRITECARSITFENAYCISLKEHFENNPDSKRTLDTDYPWTLEIGIKPKKVTVTGEQVAAAVGTGTEFTLF